MIGQFDILILTTIANFTLGLVVWLRNASQRVNQYFGIFSIAVAVWALSNGLVGIYAESPWGIIWARIAFASASVIPLSLFAFVNVFPSSKITAPKFSNLVWLVTGLSAFLLSLTSLIAQSTATVDGVLKVKYGPLHPLFGIYFISCLIHSLLLLARKLRLLKGLEKVQVRDVFLGVSLSILGGTITNLIIPLVFRSSRFSQYGPLFAILMIAMTAHAIVRHRLMNIRLVIRRSVVWVLAVAAAGGVRRARPGEADHDAGGIALGLDAYTSRELMGPGRMAAQPNRAKPNRCPSHRLVREPARPAESTKKWRAIECTF